MGDVSLIKTDLSILKLVRDKLARPPGYLFMPGIVSPYQQTGEVGIIDFNPLVL